MFKHSGEYDHFLGSDITIGNMKYPDNAEGTTEETEQNYNTVTPAYKSSRTKIKMGVNMNVISDYLEKLPKKNKTKPARENATYQNFTCMEKYVNDVKADLIYSNDTVCNYQYSKNGGSIESGGDQSN